VHREESGSGPVAAVGKYKRSCVLPGTVCYCYRHPPPPPRPPYNTSPPHLLLGARGDVIVLHSCPPRLRIKKGHRHIAIDAGLQGQGQCEASTAVDGVGWLSDACWQ
jgi:hypothetical protein